MCLILLAFKVHPDYPLVLAANRDEFYERPTQGAHWWKDLPHIVAGKDLKAGGTWLGVNRYGRFAAITNFREVDNIKAEAPSRGDLVLSYLKHTKDPKSYLSQVKAKGQAYNGFNLLCGDKNDLFYYGNRGKEVQRLSPGIYGLSNHLLDTPWPKVARGKELLADWVKGDMEDLDELFDILHNTDRPADGDLPDTGVGLEWERSLSSMFIDIPSYGTRVSSLLRIHQSNEVLFVEKDWKSNDQSTFRFTIAEKVIES